jgi:hypothetical protein
MGNARILSHVIIFLLFLSCVFTCMGGEGRKEEGDPKKLRVN